MMVPFHEPGTTSVTNPPSRVSRISCGAIHWRRSSDLEVTACIPSPCAAGAPTRASSFSNGSCCGNERVYLNDDTHRIHRAPKRYIYAAITARQKIFGAKSFYPARILLHIGKPVCPLWYRHLEPCTFPRFPGFTDGDSGY
jgi:hypothetical protein